MASAGNLRSRRPEEMALNLEAGWSEGDDIRVLVAAGLPIGAYQVQQIQQDMNYMALRFPHAISPVIDLLDAWDAAQQQMVSLNESSESRVLTKVDVLEWSVSAPGLSYSPERELDRVRMLLAQYFGFSNLFAFAGGSSQTSLVRS